MAFYCRGPYGILISVVLGLVVLSLGLLQRFFQASRHVQQIKLTSTSSSLDTCLGMLVSMLWKGIGCRPCQLVSYLTLGPLNYSKMPTKWPASIMSFGNCFVTVNVSPSKTKFTLSYIFHIFKKTARLTCPTCVKLDRPKVLLCPGLHAWEKRRWEREIKIHREERETEREQWWL